MLSIQTRTLLDLTCAELRLTAATQKRLAQQAAEKAVHSGAMNFAGGNLVGSYFEYFKTQVKAVQAAALQVMEAANISELDDILRYVDEMVWRFVTEMDVKVRAVSTSPYSREEPTLQVVYQKLKADFDFKAGLAIAQHRKRRQNGEMHTPESEETITLDILKRVAKGGGKYSASVSSKAFTLFQELEESGYITGQIGPDAHDEPDTMVAEVRLTANGRLLMEELMARGKSDTNSPTELTTAFVNYAASVLAESYGAAKIVEITSAWARDCGAHLPFAQMPLPTGVTKRAALQENLLAFMPEARRQVLDDMAGRSEFAQVAKMQELKLKLLALDGGKTAQPPQSPEKCIMEVFISHSSRDEVLAAAIVKLLQLALAIQPAQIRCTSVSGYKLPVGADTNQRLKEEVAGAKVFIALLTPTSMSSPYVLFELGARWGKGLFLGPVLAHGATMKALGPISGINAVEATKEADMHQFLTDIGAVLSRPVCNPSVYLGELKTLISAAQKEGSAG